MQGVTLASASSLEKDLGVVGKNNVEAAAKIGTAIAERAKKAGVEQAYFDRGGFLYHGRVKALADAAREAGLKDLIGGGFSPTPRSSRLCVGWVKTHHPPGHNDRRGAASPLR